MEDLVCGWGMWVIMAFVSVGVTIGGYYIGKSKGKPVLGLLLSLFLGFIGLIIIALIPAEPGYSGEHNIPETPENVSTVYSCPYCSGYIPEGASFCPRCGARMTGGRLTPVRTPQGAVLSWDRRSPENSRCSKCRSVVPPEAPFCPWCGERV